MSNISSLPIVLARLPSTADLVQCSILVPILYIGLIGNILLFKSVYSHRPFHTSSYLLLISLGASDIIFLLTGIHQKIVNVFHLHRVGDYISKGVLCQILGYIYNVAWFINILSMVMIAINRYTLILHPNHYHSFFSFRRTTIYIIASWLICFLGLGLAFSDYISYVPPIFVCGINPLLLRGVYSRLVPISPLFAIPPVVFCYVSIILKMRLSKLKVKPSLGHTTSHTQPKTNSCAPTTSRHQEVTMDKKLESEQQERSTGVVNVHSHTNRRGDNDSVIAIISSDVSKTTQTVGGRTTTTAHAPQDTAADAITANSGTTTQRLPPSIVLTKVEHAVIFQFGFIFIIFLCSWCLFGMLHLLIWAGLLSFKNNPWPWYFLGYLITLNSALNPIIYFTFNSEMRRVIRQMIRRQ